MILSFAWAATSLLLAPMVADAIWNDDFPSTTFFWFLLTAGALLPLAHEFIHRDRPYRLVILVVAFAAAALCAYALAEGGWRSRDIFWLPLAWACVFGFSDWLFAKSQLKAAAGSSQNADVKARLRGYADNNIERARNGFDANAAEFKKVFLDDLPRDESYVQFGTVSLISAKDFLATRFGFQAALAAFYIVFQRVYDDPRQSEAHSELRRHISANLSEISLVTEQEDKQPFLTDTDFQKVWELVNDPRYSSKMDELRLAVVMVGLFVGTQLKPPLAEEKDREELMLLVKRTLNRMRACLKQ